MGMRLLERPDASAKLVELGRLCVKDWKKKAKVTGYNWSGDETKMTEYVNHFLEKYRNQTTRFQVSSKNLGDAYAESVFDMGYVLPDLFRLDPKALTSMVLDKEVCRTFRHSSLQKLILDPYRLSYSKRWHRMMQGGPSYSPAGLRKTSPT